MKICYLCGLGWRDKILYLCWLGWVERDHVITDWVAHKLFLYKSSISVFRQCCFSMAVYLFILCICPPIAVTTNSSTVNKNNNYIANKILPTTSTEKMVLSFLVSNSRPSTPPLPPDTTYPQPPRDDKDKYTQKDKYKDARNSSVPVLMYIGCNALWLMSFVHFETKTIMKDDAC